MKQHAIIEKTALFISQQGGQMEVLLKAKQSGNSQFGFLSYDNELHAYYKLVLNAIRSNRYKVMTEDKEESEEEDSDGDNYLHPSLAGSTIVDAVSNNLGAQ
jgi:Surp module